MEFWLAVLLFAVACALLYSWRIAHVKRRRERVRSRPFPDEWEELLEQGVALYGHLPSNLKENLRKKILLFIDEKYFEGCDGLEITDEIRVTVAAQACLLLLNRPGYDLYPGLASILVYPDVYLAPDYVPLDDNIYIEGTGVQSGESWQEGLVVLAWHDVKVESQNLTEGYNVVLHEFAHQLDQENGWADGTPVLRDHSHARSWHSIFHREFAKMQNDGAGGRRSPLDEYGALDPAEFFAVATETFFHLPRPMRSGVPELYDVLRDYYGVDPAEWAET